MPCTRSNNCELYARFAADPSIEVWKKHYCNSSGYEKCERFKMSLKGMSVPLDLLPNGKKIVAETDSEDIGINTLFNAIKKDRMPMVKAIIRINTINEGMTNSVGITPSMFAASLGRKEMVELFLTKGCNPHKKCSKGKTALDYAEENGHSDCAETIKVCMAKAPAHEENKPAIKETASPSLFSRLFGFLRSSKQKAA